MGGAELAFRGSPAKRTGKKKRASERASERTSWKERAQIGPKVQVAGARNCSPKAWPESSSDSKHQAGRREPVLHFAKPPVSRLQRAPTRPQSSVAPVNSWAEGGAEARAGTRRAARRFRRPAAGSAPHSPRAQVDNNQVNLHSAGVGPTTPSTGKRPKWVPVRAPASLHCAGCARAPSGPEAAS